MQKICPITKKGSQTGGGYSNRVRATQFNPTGLVSRRPNILKKRIYVPELKKYIMVSLSAKGLKTLNKNGAYKTLKAAGLL